MKSLKIAILDMYDNFPNEGMRCIVQLVHRIQEEQLADISFDVFNVRAEVALPGLEYDIYISTGGPGSPLPSTEAWEQPYFSLIDSLFAWNRSHDRKKHLLLICHSFQLVSRHLGIGTLSKRKSTSFGIFPIHLTDDGQSDPVLQDLPEPFFAVDSRDYQVTSPHWERINALGVKVLCLEKDRPHVPLERALMALRFTDEVVGTQFHPEADGEGMLRYFLTEEKRQQVVANYGEAKYNDMVRLLQDPNAIELTESVIIPTFLRRAVASFAAFSEVPTRIAEPNASVA
ncbi:type 1 glutamine amidotransferase [Hymenobacter sp. BT491]|uniref:type 1 glutamine amidotransferase n=1 Tax=Hymenobacter sp. BT491 TaxID=2766779 RepID=UPI001653EAC1|nr:GMP synthase [Hymenobacter sp. BT491]MBC6989722.1 GMP synthase [Hymenobacter sp. BT491]